MEYTGEYLTINEYLDKVKSPVTPASIKRVRRMCSGGGSKKTCPVYFNPKHIVNLGRGIYRIAYWVEKGIPQIKRKS